MTALVPAAAPPAAFEEQRVAPWNTDPFSVNHLRIGRDAVRIAIPHQRLEKYSVSVNGRSGPEFDGLERESIVFSTDGKHFAA